MQYIMKYLIFIFVCFISIIFPQEDTIRFSFDIEKYQIFAQEKLYNYLNDPVNEGWRIPNIIYLETPITELSLISIPCFWFNKNAISYKHGDNIEYIIDFKEDPSLQEVCVMYGDEEINKFYITYSDEELSKMGDSLKNKYLSGGNPFIIDNNYVYKNVASYILGNPNIFVFKIKDITGYWAIRNGYLVRLEENCILWFCSISEKNANVYFTETYSDELIRDLASEEWKIGYRYPFKVKQYDEKDFQKVFIEMNIVK